MLRVALVGNIASGKSTAEKVLKKLGYQVLDTDSVCHTLLEVMPEIAITFAEQDVFDEDGEISREKLGKLVFSNPKMKEKLEEILYPQLRVEIRRFFDEHSDKKILFVAIPLLFETEMTDLFDKILFVYCDDELRRTRLMARNNYTKEYAQTRMEAQMPQDSKVEKSDFVVYNNSTVEDLEKELTLVLEQLV